MGWMLYISDEVLHFSEVLGEKGKGCTAIWERSRLCIFLIGEEPVHRVAVVEAESADHMGLDSSFLEHGVEPAVCDAVLFHHLFSCHPSTEIVILLGQGSADAFLSAFGGNPVEVFSCYSYGPDGEALQLDAVFLYNLVKGVSRHLEQPGGIADGQEVFVEEGEPLALSDFNGGASESFVPVAVFPPCEVGAAGGAVVSRRFLRGEFASALLTNFAVDVLRVHS